MQAYAVVIEFHERWQMLASPAAKRFATFALVVDAVGEPQFQNRLLRFFWRFHDAQRKRVEIQKWISIPLEAATGNVAIQQDTCGGGHVWPRAPGPR